MGSPISWPLLPVPPGPPPNRVQPPGCGQWQTPQGSAFGCNWDQQEIDLLRYGASVEVVLLVLMLACGVYLLLRPVVPWRRRSGRWTPRPGLAMVMFGLGLGAQVTGLYMYGTPFVLRLIVFAAFPALMVGGFLLLPNVVSSMRRLLHGSIGQANGGGGLASRSR